MFVRRTFFPFLTQGAECVARRSCFGANLTTADLSGKDLKGVNFTRAELAGADLSGANLTGALLSFAESVRGQPAERDPHRRHLAQDDLPRRRQVQQRMLECPATPSITIHNSSGSDDLGL